MKHYQNHSAMIGSSNLLLISFRQNPHTSHSQLLGLGLGPLSEIQNIIHQNSVVKKCVTCVTLSLLSTPSTSSSLSSLNTPSTCSSPIFLILENFPRKGQCALCQNKEGKRAKRSRIGYAYCKKPVCPNHCITYMRSFLCKKCTPKK